MKMMHVSRALAIGVCGAGLITCGGVVSFGTETTQMIGFRGDGTGIFPADCKPPAEFDAIKGNNLVWRVPLPNFSNSSPIVVGNPSTGSAGSPQAGSGQGRVFVVCAAGWPEGQDCAQLLCFDAESGKEMWKRDLDEFAMMPEAQAKEAREVRKEYHRRIRRLNNIMYEWQSADDAKKSGLMKEFAEIADVKQEGFDKYNWGTGSAEQTVYRNKAFGEKLRKVCGYDPITWSPTCLDMNMPTPVSDGKRVYVYTGRRTVHAFDLNGNVVWQVWQSDAPYVRHYPEDLANAPWIVGSTGSGTGGLLLMYVFDHLWAYELDTGKLAWKALSKARFRHGMGTPALLKVKDPGRKDQTDAFLYLWTGDLVRVRDGQIMQKDLMYAMFGSMTTDGADTLFISTMEENCVEHRNLTQAGFTPQIPPKGRPGTRALRFACGAGDTVTWEEVWYAAEVGLDSNPIFWQDRLYTKRGAVLDAKTGRVASAAKKGNDIGENGFILAGDHFYGQPGTAPGWPKANKDNPDAMEVVNVKSVADGSVMKSMPLAPMPGKIAEPELLKKVVSMTGFAYYKSSYGWHPPSASPFASGNRLFVRTFDYLYCFGDKSQPFTPSPEFRERQ